MPPSFLREKRGARVKVERILVTLGDPSGIGPEVAARAVADLREDLARDASVTLIGDGRVFEKAGKIVGATLGFEAVASPPSTPGIYFHEVPLTGTHRFGRCDAASGDAAFRVIERAIDWAATGRADAVVTAPISKQALHLAGRDFPGHTEILAYKTGTAAYAMCLAGPRLRVVLATIHVALRDVPGLIVPDRVSKTIELADAYLKKYWGIARPRIAVAALNPHAGEAGKFGDEEDAIGAGIAAARAKGADSSGPFAADALFWRAYNGEFDVVVAMYHDQGLGPLKLVHFDDAINVTLGLPFPRTSPDHGTAFELAGRGCASAASMKAAITGALAFARRVRGGAGNDPG